MTTAGSDHLDLAQVRFDNAMALFDEFVAQTVTNPDVTVLRGLERRFAEQVLIQPSYWSQIKSRSRQIGERLARQFEARCRKPAGWMDHQHGAGTGRGFAAKLGPEVPPPETSGTPRDDDERFIVGLVLSYYRRHPARARARLLDLLGEVLAPPPGPPPVPAESRPVDSHELWQKTSQGVAPLKRRT